MGWFIFILFLFKIESVNHVQMQVIVSIFGSYKNKTSTIGQFRILMSGLDWIEHEMEAISPVLASILFFYC